MWKIVSRFTIIPLLFIGSPIIYFISRCLVDHEETIDMIREIMEDFWYGIDR